MLLNQFGQLEEAAELGSAVLERGCMILSMGHWSHAPASHDLAWKKRAWGHLAQGCREPGGLTVYYLHPLARYTDPISGRVWVDYGGDAAAWDP